MRNFAGKSTTMRVIVGLDAPDAGTALIGGRPYRSLRRPLTHVGALLDAAALQPSRSARNHLLWLAHSQGLTASRVDEVVAQSGLQGAIRRKAGGYSLGTRQRLGIAAALLGDPPVLMFDELFDGMDPEGIVWMRGFLRCRHAGRGDAMTAGPYQSRLREGPYGFADLVHAEWTKFRTVRGWVIAVIAGALAIVAFALAPGQQGSCNVAGCIVPVGPGGEQVSDGFYFVHQPLAGNGSITVRVTSLTGQIPQPAQHAGAGMRAGLVPWAKAGIIVKAGTRPGSAYAAMMVTGSHGVRMQYDFTQDLPGLPGAVSAASPRWLRLTRYGATITGYDSADGTHWARAATATLAGLPPTAQVGLFTTSPQYQQTSLGEASISGGPSLATGIFDHVDLTWPGGPWAGDNVGGGSGLPGNPVGFSQAAGTFTLTGSGDIAPAVSGGGGVGVTVAQTLVGTFAGLIVLAVAGAMFMTAEYRRRLILFTLAAAPRRGRVLAAKAVVGRRGHLRGRAGRRCRRRGARPAGPARQRRLRVPGERADPGAGDRRHRGGARGHRGHRARHRDDTAARHRGGRPSSCCAGGTHEPRRAGERGGRTCGASGTRCTRNRRKRAQRAVRSGCCSPSSPRPSRSAPRRPRRRGTRQRPAARTPPRSACPASTSARRSSRSWPCWRSAANTAPA